MPTTPLRIKMPESTPTCTGWACRCPAPYGFGNDGNKICMSYGPNATSDPVACEKYIRMRRAEAWKMKKTWLGPLHAVLYFRTVNSIQARLEKKREDLEWALDFEDRCRTQGFFEARERQRAYDADAPARARRDSWERYRDAELKSSCRSIQTLKFDDC